MPFAKEEKKPDSSNDPKKASTSQPQQAAFIREVPDLAWHIIDIANHVDDESTDCFDSGASMHLTANRERLENIHTVAPVTIRTATGNTFISKEAGDMTLTVSNSAGKTIIRLTNVRYAPELHTTLISISCLADAGIHATFEKSFLRLKNADGKIIGQVPRINNVYALRNSSP